jgi:hypothetical protein
MGAFTSGIAYIAYTTGQPPQDIIQGENYPNDYTYHIDFYTWLEYF